MKLERVFIPDEYERDVWFFSKKFGLRRTSFRFIMRSPIVYQKVHALNYETTTAKDLYDALEDGARFSASEQNHASDVNYISRRAIVNCRNRLLRRFDEGG